MKERILFLLKVYFGFVLYFLLQKPMFMLVYFDRFSSFDLVEWFRVIWHGLPLDFSIAAYLIVIPVLCVIVSVWHVQFLYRIQQFYFIAITLLLSIIFISDLSLYPHWGFRLDATPLFYLQSPTEALASISLVECVGALLFVLIYFSLLYYPIWRCGLKQTEKWIPLQKPFISTLAFVFLLAFLIIPIRGGVSVATMNVGQAYYSEHMLLNHAAINPAFSLMSSVSRQQNFDKQYRFMTNDEAIDRFSKMYPKKTFQISDSTRWIKEKPNVLLILLESFSAVAMEKLGGEKGVMPHFSALADEGILFTNFYASSFRTDRGLVSVLSGYPGQPTTSIMKYPVKTQSLPSISRELSNVGYDLQFLYGGDADFTNMRSYFVSSGISNIVCDTDFPIADRISKWGANDDITFNYLAKELFASPKQPFMKLFLTLSSHEPFEVPYHKFENKYLNSVAFTDSCLGDFITKFKQSPLWDNTLILLVPDHAIHYPASLSHYEPRRYHIPMVWAGGAVVKPRVVAEYASQIDIAATLLAQMGINHSSFTFSKNIANPHIPHFAYYTFTDGFGMFTKQAKVIYDNESQKLLLEEGARVGDHTAQGQAFLQKLYDDLARR